MRDRLLFLEPPHRVEVDALADVGFVGATGSGQRGGEFAQRGFEFLADAQLVERCGDAEHKQRAGFVLVEAGEVGAVAVEQGDTATRPTIRVDRHPSHAEGVDVAVDGADGDLEFRREGLRGHFPSALQEHQER